MIYSLASIAFTIGLLLAWSMCRLAALADIGPKSAGRAISAG